MYEPNEPQDEFEQELRDRLKPREAPAGFAERVLALAARGNTGLPKTGEELRAEAHIGATKAGSSLAAMAAEQKLRVVGASTTLNYQPAVRWAIAATLLIAVALGGYAERQRQIAGEHARQQVLLALRITGLTLRAVHDKVAVGDD